MTAHLLAVGSAVPDHDVHAAFIEWAAGEAAPRHAALIRRMADRAGIRHRWTVIPAGDHAPIGPGGFYPGGGFPGTAHRMAVYAEAAPPLALAAVASLSARCDLAGVTHLVVASCTGFVAPGLDQIVARALGLPGSTERLLIGFMGCYAAVAALRSARHVVRSDPKARVLVICCELSTLHLQETDDVEALLAMLQSGDGAATARPAPPRSRSPTSSAR